jgi:hypothetical protein
LFSTLAYRSRAVAPFSQAELLRLVNSVEARNRAESVTGQLIYEDGCFCQWLEGPAGGVARIWEAIRHDPRHTDIEVIGRSHTLARCFGDWAMKLATRQPGWLDRADLPAQQLARLLVEPDAAAAIDKVEALHSQTGSFERLAERVARCLGDLWQADDCSEIDVMLALGRLQACLRQLPGARSTMLGAPAVLVVPQPGEPHMLTAMLDAERLWRGGWNVHAEFPASDRALEMLVGATRFDALDISLSPAFRRDHWLPRVARTITSARAASRNPALVVLLGGRVVGDQPGACAQAGADAACDSCLRIESVLTHELCKLHWPLASAAPLPPSPATRLPSPASRAS